MTTITYTSYRKQKLDDTFSVLYAGGTGGGGGTSVSGAYLQKTGDTATGNYAFSTSLLYIDEDDNRIGIGTASPSAKLHVMASGTASSLFVGDSATGKTYASIGTSADTNGYLNIQAYKTSGSAYGDVVLNASGGNVGIGISPSFRFHIRGGNPNSDLMTLGTTTTGNFALTSADGGAYGLFGGVSNTGRAWLQAGRYDENIAYDLTLQTSGGNVGISTTSPIYKLDVTGTGRYTSHLYTGANVGTTSFSSGFAGSGWQLGYSGTDANLTVDNLTVRKSMSIYELIINQIRATNGSVWVSDAVKLSSVTDHTTYYTVWIDGDGDNPYNIVLPFATNDIVRCQKWNGRDLKYYTAIVDLLIDDISFELSIIDGTGTPAAGDDLVRIGNSTDTNRQGSIYLTASDTNAPYIDVLDGVTSASFSGKTKVRLGKLTGITDSVYGALSGYGLYSENVYLSGWVRATAGAIGGFTLNSTDGLYSGTGSTRVQMKHGAGIWCGATAIGDAPFSVTNAGVLTASSGTIGGWSITSAYLAKDTGTDSTSAGMAPSDYPVYAGAAYANRATAPFRITNAGNLYANRATIKTAESGKRIELNSTELTFYGTSDSYYATLYNTAGTYPILSLKGISSSVNYNLYLSTNALHFYNDSTSEIDITLSGASLSMKLVGLPTTNDISPNDWKPLYINNSNNLIARYP